MGHIFFCSLDLAYGYHQIPMSPADMEKTAFRVAKGGLYEYTRMPFGLCGAQVTFMRLMDKMFGDQNFQTMLIYLDDICLFGSSFEETLQQLDLVLSRLMANNLKVKPEKCHFFMKKVQYLGHTVSEGIKCDLDKT